MKKNFLIFPRRKKDHGWCGQAMVEFAIALPMLLVLLIGIMEVGRMLLMYALVTNASRNAARYASSVGVDVVGGVARYRNCDGIKSNAKSSSYFLRNNITIKVTYDSGTLPNPIVDYCNGVSTASVTPAYQDRVTVLVEATYQPVVKLIPISQRTFKAISSRTILGIIDLQN